ncbi:unnamed protein product [Eruca vesicaria subsp. sativa]|uniref:Uncharacterized protein n=1 Tax=Eruca vesicaria subsp. sativa TaxID=29727 RepID=A0ABC8M5D9_ERUVS|nr:unnamed protein product [Eruca vesicaria subsp. sativa]
MVDKLDKICDVARGDGIVDLINVESELSRKGKSKGSSSSSSNSVFKRVRLDYSVGGHKAAVSCVAFSQDQEKDSKNNRDFLHLNIDLNKKVNWLCTNHSDSENLVVCDTTRLVRDS